MSNDGAPLTEAEVLRVRVWATRSLRVWATISALAAGVAVALVSVEGDWHDALWVGGPGLVIGAIMVPMGLRRRGAAAQLRPGVPTVLLRGTYHPGSVNRPQRLGSHLIEHSALNAGPVAGAHGHARALRLDPDEGSAVPTWLVIEWLP
jgi:hypothetical protein